MQNYPIAEGNWSWLYPLVLFLAYYVSPLIVIVLFKQSRLISDFDVTDRRERNLLNLVLFLVVLSVSVGLLFAPVPAVYKFNNTYMILFVPIFGIVTYFWKISYHMGALGWFLSTVGFLYGLTPVFIISAGVLSIAMSWSRVYLKKHTLFQTIAGLLLSISLYYFLSIIML